MGTYRGYWKNGKQNGEGEFYNEQTKTWRKCLIQNGKKIKWVDNKEENGEVTKE